MHQTSRLHVRLPLLKSLALIVLILLAAGSLPRTAQAISTNVVISQVYGGGGNSGAQYTNDFIELFNRGTSTVSLSGWSVQYTSATGSGNFGSATNLITPLSGSLAPGQYILIQEAAGATPSAALPTPDITDASPINMAAGGGKVALVNTTTPLGCNGSSTPCSAAALATIVDLIGWDGANFFEGSGSGPTTTNTTAAIRLFGGCLDTDNNNVDFGATAQTPNPRNTSFALNICPADLPPFIVSTSPASNSFSVALNTNVTINFSEPVNVSGSWFTITCTTSGAHTAAVSGGPTTFTIDPDVDFVPSDACKFIVLAAQVADQDNIDPPDNMAANYSWGFTFAPRIHDIQAQSHLSPFDSLAVGQVPGIVTAKRSNGFYLQDPNPDGVDATSEGIFVFTSSAPSVSVGDAVSVAGTVQEFRSGGATSTNLTLTELGSPSLSVTVLSSGNALPVPIVIGTGGRMPPTTVIEDDATGNVETSGTFDPASDGIDFYESLEFMRVQMNNVVAVGPWHDFGSNRELPVIGDNGANASVRTARGGIIIRSNDFNPERVILNDLIVGGPTLPAANVADTFPGATIGIIDYNFGNFKLEVTNLPGKVSGGLAREVTAADGVNQLAVATFNVENLDVGDGATKFNTLAGMIVTNLQSPDIVAVEEIQDNNGPTDDGTVDAATTYNALIAAISAAGGPTYQFRQINPVNDQDGGEPGGNIRQGFLFRTDQGLSFVDRPGAGSTTANSVVGSGATTQLQYSPGRIDPTNAAFTTSRKPLAAEFLFNGHHVFVIANHFNSKGGDQPLFGHFQPPVLSSEVQRLKQAQVVHDFVNAIETADPNADVVVLGDLNDFEFSNPINLLKGTILHDLIESLPAGERYSYVFDGNSQTLDQILFSNHLFNSWPFGYDVVHVNSEFFDQASDHEPQVVRITLNVPDAGFLTGSGWFASPAGAYPANPSFAGKVEFNVDAKYENDGTTLNGSVALALQKVDFEFASTSLQGLVVSGNTAWLKGVGTVNGAAGYTFLLSGFDGKPTHSADMLRIRILNGSGSVVYDNQPGAPEDANPAQALGGGTVTLHAK